MEDSEELVAKAAALKAKQDRAEAAKAAKAANQKRRKLLGLRCNWLLLQFMVTCTTTLGQSNAHIILGYCYSSECELRCAAYELLCVEYELQCGDVGAHFIGLMLIVPVIR